MNKLFVSLCLIASLSLFSSCYAFLKADKLIYSGTIAKKPITDVSIDTVESVLIKNSD